MQTLVAMLALASSAPPFELKDGDRVVWIGSAVAEREQKYGYWETALLCRFADRKVTFRNLGWSGDTVEGIARASFDPPAKGYERLVKAVKVEKPTVIFVSYGSVEALEENADSEKFETNLVKLLEDLKATKARVVLFSPTPMEPNYLNYQGNLIPTKATQPQIKALSFVSAVGAVAQRGGHRFADLYTQLSKHQKSDVLTFTDNGLHLSESGYEKTIHDLFASLDLTRTGEDPKKFEAVRKAVMKKNELFFHKWRPQNETYLYGFRRKEQGKNAKEVDELGPLIDAAEKDIAAALKAIKP